MKFVLASIGLLTVAISAAPNPQGGTLCPTVCVPPGTICANGGAPGGDPGCLSCCRRGRPPPTCNDLCLTEKPECPVNTVASGHEGCWGCCLPG